MEKWIIAAFVAVIAVGGAIGAFAATQKTTANVEVRVWQKTSDGSLYLSTRPEGGSWITHNTALDMSQVSRSGNFRQSSFVTVGVPVEVDVPAGSVGGPPETKVVTLGEVVETSRLDVVVFSIERRAFTTEDGVVTARVDVQLTNTRGAVEIGESRYLSAIAADGQEEAPYHYCHSALSQGQCPNALKYEVLNPGDSIRAYVYFVEPQAYPFQLLQINEVIEKIFQPTGILFSVPSP